MGKEGKEKLLQRLRRIEGQIKGIHRMIEEDRSCEATLTQLIAARAAVDKAIALLVEQGVQNCLIDRSPEEARADFLRVLDLILRVC